MSPHFTTMGMFIIDEFSFADDQGNPTGKTVTPQAIVSPTSFSIQILTHSNAQIGGGGTYAAIGARIWLQPNEIRMVIDRGYDFPSDIEQNLLKFGRDMWAFRDQPSARTTRALNAYRGERRGFEYTTPRIRITPRDLAPMGIEKPETLHFICSPTRAAAIISEVQQVEGWSPLNIYEPIPDRCVPEELPALKKILHDIAILSPNAGEALSVLSVPLTETKDSIERAANALLDFGIGKDGRGWVIIRSGAMGAYVKSRATAGRWIEAYWTPEDGNHIVDVTGAGNAFLGGLAAGLKHAGGDVEEAVFYASVSASFIIEQQGLPTIEGSSDTDAATWNADSPRERLRKLKERHPRTRNAE